MASSGMDMICMPDLSACIQFSLSLIAFAIVSGPQRIKYTIYVLLATWPLLVIDLSHIGSGVSAFIAGALIGSCRNFHKVPADVPFLILSGCLWFAYLGHSMHFVRTAFIAAAAAIMTWLCLERVQKSKTSRLGAFEGVLAGLGIIAPMHGTASTASACAAACSSASFGVAGGLVCYVSMALLGKIKIVDKTSEALGEAVERLGGAIVTGVSILDQCLIFF
ncbi:unnamed protein product [Effrenium voratum]|uniref:Uncharacterized protein n=1 Tax=Effrenium voratum TaxID=2562239 RepID=A0AA36HV47_9DINO|nr:unnamed protein product [Effrenium voratum]CAJ1451631.1 unnamed protein product [Effrenium voratum]